MGLAFALLFVGGLVIYMGAKNISFADALSGHIVKLDTQDHSTGAADNTAITTAPRPANATHPQPHTHGLGRFDGIPVAAWIIPYLTWARAHGWKGHVTQGFRTYAQQASIYNSGTRPAARPGTSNHEKADFPGGAVDVSDAAELSSILSKYPGGSLLQWAGAKDPVHFSYPHNGSY